MKKILAIAVAIIIGIASLSPVFASTPVFAEGAPCTCSDGSPGHKVEASILTDICDCGNGEGIKEILKLVVDIMSIGVGILAVIGISVSGVQYLTAGGSEEKTRKAKRRILEIVIGLIAYVLIYALLRFLLPGFNGVKNM